MRIFNLFLPDEWIIALKQMAREESVKRKSNISVSRLIREAIQEKYINKIKLKQEQIKGLT